MTNEELRRLRKAKPLTQAELAEAIGYSRQAIIGWENKVHPIPETVAIAIVAACVGEIKAKPANAKLTADTVKYYREMRRDFSHARILQRWAEAGFTPSPEAQAAIVATFPDILENNNVSTS